jgi:hypothetical protein
LKLAGTIVHSLPADMQTKLGDIERAVASGTRYAGRGLKTEPRRQMREAIKALLETIPSAVVERNIILPEKIPAGGLIILRDGHPGEPEQALGDFGDAYCQQLAELDHPHLLL